MKRKEIILVILALAAALSLRIYFVPSPGYENDVRSFKLWSKATTEYGMQKVYVDPPANYQLDGCYLPPYLYVLKTAGHFYKIFYPKFDEHTYLLDFLIKFPGILADILISIAIFLFLRKRHPFKVSFLAMAAYAFNPAAILLSACWGQTDSIISLIVLGAVLASINNKFELTWSLFTLGILTKPTAAAIFPVLLLLTWKRKGYRGLLSGMACSWWTFVLVLLPFFLFHHIDKILDHFIKLLSDFPCLSLNAFNFWWLLCGRLGNWPSDTALFLGLISYRMAGIICLVSFFVLLMRYLYHREKDESAVFAASALSFFSMFMLATKMHERYILFPLVFLLLAAVKDRGLMAAYGALSLTAFMNMLMVLFWVYPKSLPPLPHFLLAPAAGILISLINILLFLFMSYPLVADIKIDRKYLGAAAAAVVLAVILAITALHYIRSPHPAFLSDLSPIRNSQQWGQLQIDHTVDGHGFCGNGFCYKKGLGTHAYSSIEYALDGRFRCLEGAIALDEEARQNNKIEAFIYADDKQIYDSGILTGWENPRYFYLRIARAKVLKLVITDGGDGITRDHADWLGIKVLP